MWWMSGLSGWGIDGRGFQRYIPKSCYIGFGRGRLMGVRPSLEIDPHGGKVLCCMC